MLIRNGLEGFFCLQSNLSNDNITILLKGENGYGLKRYGLETGVENYLFWSEIGSGFGEPGSTPPLRIPGRTPPLPGPLPPLITLMSGSAIGL